MGIPCWGGKIRIVFLGGTHYPRIASFFYLVWLGISVLHAFKTPTLCQFVITNHVVYLLLTLSIIQGCIISSLLPYITLSNIRSSVVRVLPLHLLFLLLLLSVTHLLMVLVLPLLLHLKLLPITSTRLLRYALVWMIEECFISKTIFAAWRWWIVTLITLKPIHLSTYVLLYNPNPDYPIT